MLEIASAIALLIKFDTFQGGSCVLCRWTCNPESRDGNGAGLGRVHLDPDPFIFHRPRPAPDSLGLDFSDPDPMGLAGPWVHTGS